MPARVRFSQYPDAVKRVTEAALPALAHAADAIGPAVVAHVPVADGVAVRTYRPSVHRDGDSFRVEGFGPFWHWLEYGTAHSPAYRPVEQGVRSTGLRFEAL